MPTSRRHLLQSAAASALLAGLGTTARAQAVFETVKVITGFPPGGTSDTISRRVAAKLSPGYGKSVQVENRTGAGGQLAIQAMRQMPSDGSVILQTPMSMLGIYPFIYKKLPYDPIKDFAPVSVAIVSPLVLVVNPEVPAKNVQELIAYAKANPGKVNYGSAGVGNTLHLAGELFKSRANIDITHVPYKGASAAMGDLLGGRIQMMIDLVQTPLPNIQAGKLRALGTTGAERVALLPDVPTIAEQGLPGFQFATWIGIAAPAGTPKPIVDRLHAEMVKALAMPDLQAAFAKQGMQVAPSASPEAFAQFMKSEHDRLGELIKRAGIQPE